MVLTFLVKNYVVDVLCEIVKQQLSVIGFLKILEKFQIELLFALKKFKNDCVDLLELLVGSIVQM